jgi:DNA-binding beta-propeller fold protein YncE
VNPKRLLSLLCVVFSAVSIINSPAAEKHYLYAATPGIRDYLDYGGHGLVVFDMDKNYRFVKRIPLGGLNDAGKPMNVKGVAANAKTHRIYVTTIKTLQCLDLLTEKLLWEKSYPGGCDRLALSPDGSTIYLPSLEQGHWHVVDAADGKVIKRIETAAGAHNTIYGLDGAHAYLAGLRSPMLRIADTKTHTVVKEVGPFDNFIRPFTINGSGTLCFVNINGLLGFEVGDMTTGKKIAHVQVPDEFKIGPTKRHGCPSHGIGLTPDEKELWLTDAHNKRVHLYDATQMPPKYIQSIECRDEPGWIFFSIDGKLAYPSTGDIIDVKTRKVIGGLTDEKGTALQSEKIIEIHLDGEKVLRCGEQFGQGQILAKGS